MRSSAPVLLILREDVRICQSFTGWLAKECHKHLYDFYASITANGAMTRSTLRNVKTTINYCFDYAVQNDYIDINTALSVRTDKLVCAPVNSHDGYTREEVNVLRKVLEASDSPHARIIRLDLCLTVRIGELEAIRWEDVDLKTELYLSTHRLSLKWLTARGSRSMYLTPNPTNMITDTGSGGLNSTVKLFRFLKSRGKPILSEYPFIPRIKMKKPDFSGNSGSR